MLDGRFVAEPNWLKKVFISFRLQGEISQILALAS